MLGLSEKELENVSLDAEHQEFEVNVSKFCNTATDIKVGLSAARILVRNPLVKWLIDLAIAVVDSLQKKLNCPEDNISQQEKNSTETPG